MTTPRGRAWPVIALGLILACLSLAAGQPTDAITVPTTLAGPATELEAALAELADTEELEEARQLHREDVRPPAEALVPYADDLAGEDGGLLATYLDRLEVALAEGELSDARSLAGAAAQLTGEGIQPPAERWDANRTALAAGPLKATEEGLSVPLVLVNPPPAGIAAYDASLTVPDAEPREATVALGQGETSIDRANATVRWASFDASSMARLSPQGAERVLLGEALVMNPGLDPGENLTIEAHATELLDPDGRPVPAVGLDTQRSIPEDSTGAGAAWWALAGAGVAAAGLGWWVHRWEV